MWQKLCWFRARRAHAGQHVVASADQGPGRQMQKREQSCALDGDQTSTRIIRLNGDLRPDATVESVRQRCLAGVTPGRRRVLLDLQQVESADTKFIALLVCLRRAAQAAGVPLELRLSPRVRELLELCQAAHLFRSAS